MVQKVETLIIGAGVIGSSVAMHLAKAGMTDIRVIDFDLEGSLSSSELNAGGVRATWVQPINIELSKASIDYFASVAPEVGYKACGYLWLHSRENFAAALKARETQVKKGWQVDVLDLPALQRKAPFLDKTDGIEGAIFAPKDGLINPNLLKSHYRNQGRALGVVYDDRTLLRSVEFASGALEVRIVAERFESVMSHETKLDVLGRDSNEPSGRLLVEYQAQRVVNCAGPWAAQVAKILKYKSPVYPVRRQVCIFDCQGLDMTPYGMIVDTTGVYFHPEATNCLGGFAGLDEKPGINYSYDGDKMFMDVIWPALFERSSYFERLKHISGWAGLYEVSPDDCGVLGEAVYGSDLARAAQGKIFEAHSFSGHGVMQSYSAGLALAEKIVQGKYQTFDVDCMSSQRFGGDASRLLREGLVI